MSFAKRDTIKKINSSDIFNEEEKISLSELLLKNKKYGLVWENKPEDEEHKLQGYLPLFKEVPERAILSSESFPNHILIEGDNLSALTALTFTHENKVDVIYIDPPYNTGKRNEFRYNDRWIDSNSPFKHSTWLSFLSKRLIVAKRLLAENSAIFISIDNNEFAQLKLLCDEIFLEQNFIGAMIWRKKEGGGQTDAYFVTEHEYVLCYKKGNFEWLDETEEGKMAGYSRRDEKAPYKAVKLEKWGSGSRKEDRETMHFAITSPDGKDFFPIAPDGNPGRYRVGKKTMARIIEEDRLFWEKKERWIPYEKVYYNPETIKTLKARSILYKLANTGDGTNELTSIFNKKDVFENPKPTALVKYILAHSSKPDSIIMDFFAGSGTTFQAAAELNEQDGGTRQCISITNNENNICEEVCYPRMSKVINGYTFKGKHKKTLYKQKISLTAFKKSSEILNKIEQIKSKSKDHWETFTTEIKNGEIYLLGESSTSEVSKGLQANNLRYFKVVHVKKEHSLFYIRGLAKEMEDSIRIKENCYSKFSSEQGITTLREGEKYRLIIDDDFAIPAAVELIKRIPTGQTIKVYVFTEGHDPYTQDFEEVLNRIELYPIPNILVNSYQIAASPNPAFDGSEKHSNELFQHEIKRT
jgi:adenine-specific DNA-methyltransferase